MKRIAITLLLSGSLMASWIPFGEGEKEGMKVSLIRANPQEVVIDVEVPGVVYEYLNTEEGRFTRLSGGTGITGNIGKPELPIITKLIEIPQSAEVKVELKDVETEEYTLSELGILHPLYPVQAPIPKIPGADKNMKFEMDRDAYKSDRFFPDRVYTYRDIAEIRGTRVIPMDIKPIQYNPAKNTIRVTKKMRIRLILSGSDISYTQWKKEKYYSPYFDEVLKKEIMNYESTKGLPQLPVDYLIIVHDDFYNNILPFAEWKTRKGFNVTITKTSEIGATAADIRNYIQNAYNTWDTPPTFCLLVGDVGQIPVSQTGLETGKVTDLYYYTVDGSDFFPDIYYGRFSGSTASHINAMVDKVVEYERNFWTQGTEWLGKMYFMTTNDVEHHSEVEYISNVCMALARENDVVCDSLYYYDETGTPISTAINDGRTIALYTGHGSQRSWAGPPFGQSQVNALTNEDKYPFVVGHCCLTGDFNVSECFAETWMRAQDKGAVAYFGSAPTSYWVWDDTLQIGWFRPMFIEPTTNFLGGITQLGLYNVYEWGGDGYPTVQYYYEAYHIFGDPSMDLYTLEPISFTVSYPGVLPLGSIVFRVNVIEDSALVALYMNNMLYGVAYSSGGEAVVNLDPIPTEEGFMHITITKHNYATYEDSIPATIPAFVTIEPDTISVNTPTWVYITVLDNSLEPIPDIEVSISGYGVMPSLVDTTNASGLCSLRVNAPYGEVLEVRGRIITETWTLFSGLLWVVGAPDFTSTSLAVSVPLFDLADTLILGYEGTIDVSVSPSGFMLFVSGCGIDTSSYYADDAGEMIVIPTTSGDVTVCIAKNGYNIYKESYPVKEFYGTLSGTVADSVTGNLIGGALIKIYDIPTRTPVFEGRTGDNGVYVVPDSLSVGYYYVNTTSFGYEEYSDTFMLFIGENIKDMDLIPGVMVVLSGIANLIDTGDDSGITVEAKYEHYTFSTTNDDRGNYLLTIPPDVLYTVKAYRKGYTEAMKEGVAVPQNNVNFTLYPVKALYFSDLEDNEGKMIGTSDWQWGTPGFGPSGAYSGEKLWATKLNSNYSNYSDSRLTTPEVALPHVSYIELSFWHWYHTEDYYDGGNVKLSTGDSFTVIEPVDGYPENAIQSGNQGIPGEPAYSDASDDWIKATFDITPYAGDTVIIGFHFGSNALVTYSGWYIDDVWIGYVDSTGIYDVGVLSILLPDSVYQDSVYIPAAIVYNYGVSELPFPVVCNIEDYTDTVSADVAPSTKGVVEFSEWIPNSEDSILTVRVETKMEGDLVLNNNLEEKKIWIYKNIPEVSALYQNRPNPFRDVTTIKYALRNKAKVTIEIYNVLGQRVYVWDLGVKEAGFHYVKWDGKDSRGVKVSSGIYFVRFTSGDFQAIKKIVKLR